MRSSRRRTEPLKSFDFSVGTPMVFIRPPRISDVLPGAGGGCFDGAAHDAIPAASSAVSCELTISW